MPNQRFQLANQPVLSGSLDLAVFEDEKKRFVQWELVNDFAASTRIDRHYTLDLVTGIIAFGDGTHGMVPPRLPAGDDEETREKDAPNVKAERYKWGGGARGNAGAGKITSIESPLPGVESVRNLRPAEGGSDEETLENVKRRAPQTIRTHSRAVTGVDFEVLAIDTPGARIRRARALPLHHPEIEPLRFAPGASEVTTVPMPGVVTVVVVPEGGADEPKPMPTEETLARVGRWLNKHRLITTELYVSAPTYRKVTISVTATVERTANLREVEAELQARLLAYFHPLTGGTGGSGWEFGGKIVFSETFRQIVKTPGVREVLSSSMSTRVDDEAHLPCTDVPLAPDEIVYSTEHFLTLHYE
jgi:predicted phage baseplate assembly protein